MESRESETNDENSSHRDLHPHWSSVGQSICRKLAPQYHCLHPGTSKLSLLLTALRESHLSKLGRASEKSEIKFLKCEV